MRLKPLAWDRLRSPFSPSTPESRCWHLLRRGDLRLAGQSLHLPPHSERNRTRRCGALAAPPAALETLGAAADRAGRTARCCDPIPILGGNRVHSRCAKRRYPRPNEGPRHAPSPPPLRLSQRGGKPSVVVYAQRNPPRRTFHELPRLMFLLLVGYRSHVTLRCDLCAF